MISSACFRFLTSFGLLIFHISISDNEAKSTEKTLFSNRSNQNDNISEDTIDTSTDNKSRKMPRKGSKRVSILNRLHYIEIMDKLIQ